jgi:hypothetical protein
VSAQQACALVFLPVADFDSPLGNGVLGTVESERITCVHDFAATGPVRWGVGGVIGLLRAAGALDSVYGKRPPSGMVFVQARLSQ